MRSTAQSKAIASLDVVRSARSYIDHAARLITSVVKATSKTSKKRHIAVKDFSCDVAACARLQTFGHRSMSSTIAYDMLSDPKRRTSVAGIESPHGLDARSQWCNEMAIRRLALVYLRESISTVAPNNSSSCGVCMWSVADLRSVTA
jgi:hypothetical protein